MGIIAALYKVARFGNDFNALKSGDPKKIGRRIKNKVLGRIIGKIGVFK